MVLNKTELVLTRLPSSLVSWRSLYSLNGLGRETIFSVDCWKVQSCWGIEERSLSGNCKDDFAGKGGIRRWKLSELEERIFSGDCRGGLYVQIGLWKWRNAYHFIENSAYFVLKKELLLTVFSNFEREAALNDWGFWWVACLTRTVLWSLYSLIINLIGLTWYMVQHHLVNFLKVIFAIYF